MSAERSRVTRRAALGSLTGGKAALGGCLGRPWSAWERVAPSPVELSILTPPNDDDIFSIRIAQHLQSNLDRAGIQSEIVPTRQATFLREVLINHNYDLYVGELSPQDDPDMIRPLLHSTFAEERGWQNPFGFTNSVVDDLIEEQLTAENEERRAEHLVELHSVLQDERPFVPIAFTEEHRLLRSDRIASVGDEPVHSPSWLMTLDGVDEDVERIELGTIDGRLTRSLNPVAVEYRGYDGVMELVYGSLARRFEGRYWPWLASDWEWITTEFHERPSLEIELREGLQWHDGEALTAADVAFTYAFLSDTTMTDEDPTIPAPRFRGESRLVEYVEVVDEGTVRLLFEDASRPLALRGLLVPILPEHIWSDWTEIVEVAGIPIDDNTTDALVEENLAPVGSGSYRVSDVQPDNLVVLERIDDHPFVDVDPSDHPIPSIGPPSVREFVLDIRPSVSNIAESIRDGALDGCISGLGHDLIEDVGGAQDVVSVSQQTSRLFHVGFNHREYSPLSHAGFRTAVERLIDRTFVRDEIFEGNPKLTRTFVFDDEFVPSSLQWNDRAPTFAGEPGTGEVDIERARESFREAGFSYSEGGDLLVN